MRSLLVLFLLLIATRAFGAGACCDDEGGCIIVADAATCEDQPWVIDDNDGVTAYYKGNGTTCDPNPCVRPFLTPIRPAAVETYVFRNGVSPTPDYDGIRLVMIAQDLAPTTNYSTSEQVFVGYDEEDGLYRGLLRFDIAALPDSFLVTEAYLHVLKVDDGVAPSIGAPWLATRHAHLYLHRVMKPWVPEEVTATVASLGLNWGTIGLGDTNGSWLILGAELALPVRTGRSTLMTADIDDLRLKDAGYAVAIGGDTLDYRTTAAGLGLDRFILPESVAPFRGRTGYTLPYWWKIELRELVGFFHQNPEQNLGLLLSLDELAEDTDMLGIELRGSAAAIPAEAPWLLVRGVHLSRAATAASRRTAGTRIGG